MGSVLTITRSLPSISASRDWAGLKSRSPGRPAARERQRLSPCGDSSTQGTFDADPLTCRTSGHRLAQAALPAKPENISCIYYYEKNFTCTWSPEKEASHTWYRVRRTHSYGRKSDTCDSTSETPTSCSFLTSITIPDNYTIQVEARNADGAVESAVTHWRLDTIVKMDPPVISSVKPVLGFKRMLQIQWAKPELAPASSALQCRLRLRTANSTHWMEVSFWVEEETEKNQTYNLTGLRAFTEYEVALRCVAQESAFWSGWSRVHSGTTEEEGKRPDPLRQRGRSQQLGCDPVEGAGTVRLHGDVSASPARKVFIELKTEQPVPGLGRESSGLVPAGLQAAETERLPAVSPAQAASSPGPGPVEGAGTHLGGWEPPREAAVEAFPGVEAVQAHLSQDRLVVAWQNSTPHVDSWRVEWSPDLDSEPPTVCWEAVTGARNWTIRRDELDPLQCYNISVYPMWQDRVGKPCSVQAYAKEGAPSVGPVTKAEGIGLNTVTIRWEEIPKHLRNGFICNYTIFYQPAGGGEFAKTVGASTLQCGLESLARGTSYYVWVMASTSAGGFNGTTINFKTLSISVLETCLAAALGGGGLLILSVLAAACGLRKPNRGPRLTRPQLVSQAEPGVVTPGPWTVMDGHAGDKLHLREVDDAVSTEDRILKPWAAPSDLIDKLAVNFEYFLEEVSAEEAEKGQENILGGDKNEYVISPFRPYCVLEPLTTAEAPPTAAEAPPTSAGGLLTSAEVPPTVAEAPPTASKALPTAAEALPTAAGGPPMAAKAPPTSSKALPTAAKAPPTAAESPPTAAGGPPTSAEVPPTVAEAPPTASKVSPTAAKAPPTSSKALPTVAEVPPREPQCLFSGSWEGTCPEAEERLLPSAQGPGPACACEEGALNPYLKNSVTTREFLLSEELPDQTKSAI
ncbi:Interleukin-31 receptor subunit alpha [Myotis davidii]|uniref:Interleukin-31 receptor subunit alpha n=1 Tax=Myotis davidii TaxID=225400 RepID=L5M222_MYODS|nr:Interleukin-31 receptor subunit alpha [Myotis davidii]